MYIQNIFYYIIGILFLFLARVKNLLKGYSSPKEFDISEIDRCIDYDLKIVDNWLSYLKSYDISDYSISGKNILELGPGSDLGIGIYLISKGCTQYNAFDVNNLIERVPDKFYEKLYQRLKLNKPSLDLDYLKMQFNAMKRKEPSKLKYIVKKEFDIISSLGVENIDIVFSQAAFEHFDDMDIAISQISQVCRSGARLIVEVDLQTHSRWIRDKDPNNIYRYPRSLYNLFWFSGIPNRIRPFQYKRILEENGWINIKIIPLKTINAENHPKTVLDKEFLGKNNQMDYLSIIICATKN